MRLIPKNKINKALYKDQIVGEYNNYYTLHVERKSIFDHSPLIICTHKDQKTVLDYIIRTSKFQYTVFAETYCTEGIVHFVDEHFINTKNIKDLK